MARPAWNDESHRRRIWSVSWEFGSRVGGHTSWSYAVSHPYQLLFRTPALKLAFLSVLLSSIPLGTITLGLVLSIQSWTGSLSLAGTITSLFSLGNAVGLTVQGALIDRFGDRIVILLAGLLSGLSLGTLGLFGSGLQSALLGGLVLIAGLTIPAITTAVRRSLPVLVTDPATRSAGYAALSVVFQLAFAVGPLLVSLAVVITDGAPMALSLAAILIIAAAALFTFAAPSTGSSRPHPFRQEPSRPRSWMAAIRPLAGLYTVAALAGVATGMTTVAVPAVTQAAGVAAVAGVAFAASAIGEVGGAIIFGSRDWPFTERRQLNLALLAASCIAALEFLASYNPWLLVLAIGLGGAIGAPVSIRLSSSLDSLTKPESLGLAYAVLVSIGLTAAAAGTSLAGQLSTRLQPRQLLLGPPILLLLATTTAMITRRRPTAQ